jgi:glycosyltransferase involved in cell wall biosynthesis
MKFLLIAGYPDSLLNFRGPLIDALLNAGLDVDVAAPDLPLGSEVRRQLEAKGVNVHDIPLRRTGMNPLADFVALLSLWALMRRIRPDYVLGYTIKPVIYGGLAAWLSSVPKRFALITGLGYAFQKAEGGRQILKRLVHQLYRFGLARTDVVFFQNPDDQALFRKEHILKSNDASVVVNGSGVDIASFRVAPLPEVPKFLLIARLLSAKGIREYAAAAALVRAKHPDIEFGLVGWIDDNPDSIAQAELDDWVSAGTLVYYGHLNDVRPAIVDSSVYVLPSWSEGTPRTVLEAMAMGRPIITTDAPGCRETVVNGKNGYLVPVRSVDALAEAMLAFVHNPDLMISMGAESRKLAEEKYDVHKVNAHMLSEMGIK